MWMNVSYLLQHVSYSLHTIVRDYGETRQLQENFCGRPDFTDSSFFHGNLEESLLAQSGETLPFLLSAGDKLVYAVVTVPKHLFIIGPVKFKTPVRLLHCQKQPGFDDNFLDTVPFCDFSDLAGNLLLMHNLFWEQTLNERDLILFNCIDRSLDMEIQRHFSDLLFENQEASLGHNPYDQELREFSSIENGDVKQLEKSWAEDYTGNIGVLAKDRLRSWKDVGIVVITLASRAAIRGGILPEISFSLSDIYINKVEEASDLASITHLLRQAEYQYTNMVREQKEQQRGMGHREKNPHVRRCKDYIFSHLHDRITTQEIAGFLGMNASYLSELFHQCEGISIKNFILREKIGLAKNMLTYSGYSYIEIAAYLGFSSQSHLGKQFKKLTGYTLSEYRNTYGIRQFTP